MSRLFAILIVAMLAGCSGGPGTPAPQLTGGAGGSSEAGNGGGLGEKGARFVARGLGQLLDLCLVSATCGLLHTEQALMRRVRAQLRERPITDEQIRFLSARRDPALFQSDGRAHGAVRSAVTSARWGDPIWINLDHLYRTRNGRTEPIDHPEIASLLFDELAHHVEPAFSSPTEHRKLDALCARLQTFLSARQDRPRLPGGGDVSVTAVQFSDETVAPRVDSWTQLLLSDGFELRDLTPQLQRLIRCPRPTEPVKGWRVENLHWHWPRPVSDERGFSSELDYRRDTVVVPLHGYLFLRCDKPEETGTSRQVYLTLRYGRFTESERGAEGRTVYWAAPPELEVIRCGVHQSDARCH